MKIRWIIILAIVLGLILGPLIKDVPGFIIIALGNYTLQTRLWQLIVVAIVSQLLLMLLYHLFSRLWRSAGNIKNWSGGRSGKKSRQNTTNGMIALAEGNWKRAEKLLIKGINNTDTPLINYLGAARAAQAQRSDARRDTYLRQAHNVEPNAEVAIGLTQATLQLNHGQYEQALASLTHLQQLAPKHEYVLFLLQKLYRQLGDWQRFIDLSADLQKSSVISQKDLESFQLIAWQNILDDLANNSGIESLHDSWLKLPKSFHKNIDLISTYTGHLIQLEGSLEAEKILRKSISKYNNNQHIMLYGLLKTHELSHQLAFVESLLKKQGDNSTVHLSIGRICLNMELWGKAKAALEKSVALSPEPESYKELARAFEALGDKDSASDCFKQGLTRALT